MARIVVTLETLKAVNRFASTEETRYYLNGVYFDNETKVLAATDGHRLLIVKPEAYMTDTFESFILSSETIAFLKAKQRKGAQKLVLIDTEQKKIGTGSFGFVEAGDEDFDAAMEQADMTVTYTPIDGTFPDYRRIVPDAENYDTNEGNKAQSYNPLYFATLANTVQSVTIFQHKQPLSPTLFRCAKLNHFDALGLVMPMRRGPLDEGADIFPAWFRPATKIEDKAA